MNGTGLAFILPLIIMIIIIINYYNNDNVLQKKLSCSEGDWCLGCFFPSLRVSLSWLSLSFHFGLWLWDQPTTFWAPLRHATCSSNAHSIWTGQLTAHLWNKYGSMSPSRDSEAMGLGLTYIRDDPAFACGLVQPPKKLTKLTSRDRMEKMNFSTEVVQMKRKKRKKAPEKAIGLAQALVKCVICSQQQHPVLGMSPSKSPHAPTIDPKSTMINSKAKDKLAGTSQVIQVTMFGENDISFLNMIPLPNVLLMVWHPIAFTIPLSPNVPNTHGISSAPCRR